MQHRSVFFISDGTGITAQSLGHLLAHFPEVTFRHIRLPYTNSVAKAEAALERVARVGKEDNARPIIVMTLSMAMPPVTWGLADRFRPCGTT